MKNSILIYLTLFAFLLVSCEKEENTENPDSKQYTVSDIVGIWENNKSFISFGIDKTFKAYISEMKFIDSGLFDIDGKNIVCYNGYTNDIRTYTIISENDSQLQLSIDGQILTLKKNGEEISPLEYSILGMEYSYGGHTSNGNVSEVKCKLKFESKYKAHFYQEYIYATGKNEEKKHSYKYYVYKEPYLYFDENGISIYKFETPAYWKEPWANITLVSGKEIVWVN